MTYIASYCIFIMISPNTAIRIYNNLLKDELTIENLV